MSTSVISPRAWSPATSGTKTADFSICVPGTSVLPYFATSSAMFSLMTSVSRVRRTWAAKPVFAERIGLDGDALALLVRRTGSG